MILTALAVFALFCFVTVFFLPGKIDQTEGEANINKAYKVYQQVGQAGRDLLVPGPQPPDGWAVDQGGPSSSKRPRGQRIKPHSPGLKSDQLGEDSDSNPILPKPDPNAEGPKSGDGHGGGDIGDEVIVAGVDYPAAEKQAFIKEVLFAVFGRRQTTCLLLVLKASCSELAEKTLKKNRNKDLGEFA